MMALWQQKRKWKKIFYSYWTLLILVALLVFLSRATFHVYQKYQDAILNESRAAKELADLTTREKTITNEVARLKTKAGVEQEIRDKYQVTKNGERLIVIVDDPKSALQNQAAVESGGWWRKVLNFFGF